MAPKDATSSKLGREIAVRNQEGLSVHAEAE